MKDKIHGEKIWESEKRKDFLSGAQNLLFWETLLEFRECSKLPKFSQFLIRWRFFEGRNCHIFSLLASKLINVIIFIQMDARQSHNLKFLYLSQQQQSPSIWFAWWSHNLQCVSIHSWNFKRLLNEVEWQFLYKQKGAAKLALEIEASPQLG